MIVADIGGTNARFATVAGPHARLGEIKSFKDVSFASFEEALAAYLQPLQASPPQAIAIGAAGPLVRGAIHLTNLNWTIEPKKIRDRFALRVAALANDLVAMASGIALAPPDAFIGLPSPDAGAARRSLVIAIGTGLGVASFEHGERALIRSSEAGHMRFAPVDRAGLRLLESLLGQRSSVSFENIISGSGIRETYAALRGAGDPEYAR